MEDRKDRMVGIELILTIYVILLLVLVVLDIKGYPLPWWL